MTILNTFHTFQPLCLFSSTCSNPHLQCRPPKLSPNFQISVRLTSGSQYGLTASYLGLCLIFSSLLLYRQSLTPQAMHDSTLGPLRASTRPWPMMAVNQLLRTSPHPVLTTRSGSRSAERRCPRLSPYQGSVLASSLPFPHEAITTR